MVKLIVNLYNFFLINSNHFNIVSKSPITKQNPGVRFNSPLFLSVVTKLSTLSNSETNPENIYFQFLGVLKLINKSNINNNIRRVGKDLINDPSLNDTSRLLCEWLNSEFKL